MQYAMKQDLLLLLGTRGSVFSGLQTQRKQPGLRGAKIRQLDAPADVERCRARVADEVGRSRHTQQAKGEPRIFRVFTAAVITFPNCGEELVG